MTYSVNLHTLSPPQIIEELRFEDIYAQKKARLIAYNPNYAKALALESDPLAQELQAASYGELLLRQRINNAALATMLPFSTGTNLDAIGANYNVARLLISPANPNTIPPTPAIMEDDERLRARIQLALEATTTAGSRDSYIYHVLSISSDIKSVSVITPRFKVKKIKDKEWQVNTANDSIDWSNPIPGAVGITFITNNDDGMPDDKLASEVIAALSAENIRPLTDFPQYIKPTLKTYKVKAELTIYPDMQGAFAVDSAKESLQKYCELHHRLDHDITISGLTAALHVAGVQNVKIIEPAADIVCHYHEAAYCETTSIKVIGYEY